jgi:ABC-type Zn uptake system ZnuABC Zn-binding protein ZnuA
MKKLLLALGATLFLAGCGSSSTPVPVTPPPPVRSLTLTWAPPRKNTDGTPLTLAGYRVYHDGGVETCSAAVNTVVITPLSAGPHSFVLTAMGINGVESARTCTGSGVAK